MNETKLFFLVVDMQVRFTVWNMNGKLMSQVDN